MAPTICLWIVFVTLNRVYKERKLELVSISHSSPSAFEQTAFPLTPLKIKEMDTPVWYSGICETPSRVLGVQLQQLNQGKASGKRFWFNASAAVTITANPDLGRRFNLNFLEV